MGIDSPVSMDWSRSTSPPMSFTSAATTQPSESFTISPGTSSEAATGFHNPSRRTDAVSARRDFNAARVACARLSWSSPSTALNTRRNAMIEPSTYFPSTSSSTTAASSIHGTGAQNFSSAIRNGCMLVSGTAFEPTFSSRVWASSLERPRPVDKLFDTGDGDIIGDCSISSFGSRAYPGHEYRCIAYVRSAYPSSFASGSHLWNPDSGPGRRRPAPGDNG